MTKKKCGYCGTELTKANSDKEHVFPACLYPNSKKDSKVQRLTIPSCKNCNRGWSNDEAHFRNVLMIAGDPPTPLRQEIWEGPVLRSFDEIDGYKRVSDLYRLMKPVTIAGEKRHMIFPGEDPKVLRIVRKIIRGLSYYHQVLYPISDEQVWADVLKYKIPQEYWEMMKYHHREPDIAEYWYEILDQDDIHSAWIISFYKSVNFIGIVSKTPQHLVD